MASGLNDYERDNAEQAVSSSGTLLSSAVARLYRSEQGTKRWEYSGICGAAVVVDEYPCYYLRILDLNTYEVAFEQECYVNFLYAAPKPFFHVFEADDCVSGLSFADNSEAQHFFNSVNSAKKSIQQWKEQQDSQPAYEPPTNNYYNEPIAPPISRSFSEPGPPPNAYNPGPNYPSQPSNYPPSNSSPTNYPKNLASSYSGPVPSSNYPSSSSNYPAPISSPSLPSRSTIQPEFNRSASSGSLRNGETDKDRKKREAKEEKDRKEQKKRDDKLKLKQQREDQKRKPLSIAGPTGVQHVSHMGWDAVNGFQLQNIPQEWRQLFKDAGIKKSELQNPDTARFIMSTVKQAMVTGSSGPSLEGFGGMMPSSPPSNYPSNPSYPSSSPSYPPSNYNNLSSSGSSMSISGPIISQPIVAQRAPPARARGPPAPMQNPTGNTAALARGRVPPPPPQNLANGRAPPPPPMQNSGSYNSGYNSGNSGSYNSGSFSQLQPNRGNTGPRMAPPPPRQQQYNDYAEDIPPPPPPMEGAPYADDIPPPPPMDGYDAPSSPTSSNPLLAQIQKPKVLKPVTQEPKEPPPPPQPSLLETLASAMAQRRVELKEDEDGGGDEDGWSDEDWN